MKLLKEQNLKLAKENIKLRAEVQEKNNSKEITENIFAIPENYNYDITININDNYKYYYYLLIFFFLII